MLIYAEIIIILLIMHVFYEPIRLHNYLTDSSAFFLFFLSELNVEEKKRWGRVCLKLQDSDNI